MLITSIVKQKNGTYEVYADGERYEGIDAVTLLSNRIKVGATVDDGLMRNLIDSSAVNHAFSEGIKYLSRARHTEGEVRLKLQSKGYSECAVDEAVGKLKDYGYVNDEAYAKAYVSVYSKSRGKNRLVYEMTQKGISKEVILANLPDDEYESAYLIADKKRSKYEDSDKLIRYLMGRGFDYELSRRVVRDLEGER